MTEIKIRDQNDRDELLIRLDERTANMQTALNDQAKCLDKIDKVIADHNEAIIKLNTTVFGSDHEEDGLINRVGSVEKTQTSLSNRIWLLALAFASGGGLTAGLLKLVEKTSTG